MIGWLDCSAGVSGDMLLGALHDAGALDDLPAALRSLGLGVSVEPSQVTRNGVAATAVEVHAPADQPHRHVGDLLALVAAAAVPDAVRTSAADVLHRLAAAEARVHGVAVDEVTLHEVGAVDTVVDVLGVCLGVHNLGIDRLVTSPVALGGGRVEVAHGSLPVPVPAVVQLLAGSGLVGYGGPIERELATPTGIALLASLAEPADAMPAMRVQRSGVGAGAADPAGHANVVRLLIGTAPAEQTSGGWLLLEANVDDLDPRLWPTVLDRLLAAGAADAWLTPILMKKGRPAHTLSVLAPEADAAAVRTAMFEESSTIGVRSSPVGKQALDRSWREVSVEGHAVRVKIASLDGQVVNISPEWEDVASAARATGRPAKWVLAAAIAAAGVRA